MTTEICAAALMSEQPIAPRRPAADSGSRWSSSAGAHRAHRSREREDLAPPSSLFADEPRDDHHNAHAANNAGDLSDGFHQTRGIVRLRCDGQHEEVESAGNDDENDTDDDDPPVPSPHSFQSPLSALCFLTS